MHPVPGATVAPQLPPCVKLEDVVMELIVKGDVLTLRKARIGLTRGESEN